MSLRIVEQVALSDVGRQRSSNEDSYFQGSPVFAVADGMGGAQAGEVASSIAVKTVGELMDGTWDTPEARLVEIATEANRRIHDLSQKDSSRQGMGCTLTIAFVGDGEVTFGHVGDSRAYRLRDGGFEQLTNDHSLVEELVRQGKLTAEEAEVHPQRSIITRALGPEGQVEVDAFTHAAKPGDIFLLCSDGLTGMVTDERITELLETEGSLADAAAALIAAANENGGRDNITVVLFRVGKDDGGDEDAGSTQVDLTADQVRDAAAMTKPADVQATVPRDTQETARHETPADPDAAPSAERGVDDYTRVGTPILEAPPPRPAPPGGAPPRRGRRLLAVLITVLVVAAIVVGIYVGTRQFWFVGSNDTGLLTLYRGVPYELPLGLVLYSEEYVSSVPARTIRPRRRRDRVLDHQLRSRGDAVDLIRQYERARVAS